ncbi:MED23 polymerase, partial [Polypterus senegalus]
MILSPLYHVILSQEWFDIKSRRVRLLPNENTGLVLDGNSSSQNASMPCLKVWLKGLAMKCNADDLLATTTGISDEMSEIKVTSVEVTPNPLTHMFLDTPEDERTKLISCLGAFQQYLSTLPQESHDQCVQWIVRFIHSQHSPKRISFLYDCLAMAVEKNLLPPRMVCEALINSDSLEWERTQLWALTFKLIRKIIGGVDYKVVEYILDRNACLLPAYFAITEIRKLYPEGKLSHWSAASFPEQTPIAKTILKINQAQQEVLKKLFRTAYYVAKSELPLAKFSSLCKLQKANGLDLGSTYLNDHACREFIGAIAQISRDQIEKEIQESRFLSILADGSTDTGIIEQELVHVRYVRDNGDISTYMIKCQPVKSANAAGILEAIDEAVNTMGIREDTWKRK